MYFFGKTNVVTHIFTAGGIFSILADQLTYPNPNYERIKATKILFTICARRPNSYICIS